MSTTASPVRSLCHGPFLVPVAVTLALALLVSPVLADEADPPPFVVSGSVTEGSGSNTSYLVVDFDATGGDSFAFAYHWDTATDGLGLLDALADNLDDPNDSVGVTGLAFEATFFALANGYFVDNITFGNTTGDPNQYWAQWQGTYNASAGDVDWQLGNGISELTLTDGLFVGLRNPYSTAQAPTLPIPEPASALLVGLGLISLSILRRQP